MYKRIILIAVILLFTCISYGDTFFVESISVEDTAIGIGINARDSNLKRGIFSCEGGNVRWWTNGTSPTNNTGHLLYQDDYLIILGINNLRGLKFIRTGSNTTTIRASYEN